MDELESFHEISFAKKTVMHSNGQRNTSRWMKGVGKNNESTTKFLSRRASRAVGPLEVRWEPQRYIESARTLTGNDPIDDRLGRRNRTGPPQAASWHVEFG